METAATLAIKQTKDIESQLATYMQALFYNKEKLLAIRQERLRRLLTHAKTSSSWYRRKLAHIDVENFTEAQLPELPTLNKAELMENWDEIVTRPDLSLAAVQQHIQKMQDSNELLFLNDRYRLMVTSGSSGRRGIFLYDWEEWNTYFLMFKRYRFYNNSRTKTLLNPFKKTKIGAVVGTNPIHSIYSLEKSYKSRNTETFHFPLTSPMVDIVTGLNQTQPDILLGSSSTIFKLAAESRGKKLNIFPTIISLYGEPFYPPVRKAIEEAWPSAAIFNTFGTSEGLSASYCRANSTEMHLNEDLCITEAVNAVGAPVKIGEPSQKLYITNLFNLTLPLIRYEIPDELTFLNKTCVCGSSHQLIAEPQARPDFDFTYQGDIFVNHIVFAYPLLSDENIKEYQVVQTVNGADIKLIATGSSQFEKIQQEIGDKLAGLGLHQPQITFTRVDKFDYPHSGKLRRFIPL